MERNVGSKEERGKEVKKLGENGLVTSGRVAVLLFSGIQKLSCVNIDACASSSPLALLSPELPSSHRLQGRCINRWRGLGKENLHR